MLIPCTPVNQPFQRLAQRCKRLLPLLAAPAALLIVQGQAKAVLSYNIFETPSGVVVEASGSVALSGPPVNQAGCVGFDGAISAVNAIICTGPFTALDLYGVTGPPSFVGSYSSGGGSSTSSISTFLAGEPFIFPAITGIPTPQPFFGISPSYISGTPFTSSSLFPGLKYSDLGFTTSGLIGTWTLDSTGDTIQLFATPPVPGPLPLLGAGAAFGWSRRLRRRIASPSLPSTRV